MSQTTQPRRDRAYYVRQARRLTPEARHDRLADLTARLHTLGQRSLDDTPVYDEVSAAHAATWDVQASTRRRTHLRYARRHGLAWPRDWRLDTLFPWQLAQVHACPGWWFR